MREFEDNEECCNGMMVLYLLMTSDPDYRKCSITTALGYNLTQAAFSCKKQETQTGGRIAAGYAKTNASTHKTK